jgi:hypothetical protein
MWSPFARGVAGRAPLASNGAVKALLVAAVAACGVTDPRDVLPDGAVAFAPPSEYRALWAATEQCAARRRPFAAVRWFQVPGAWEVVIPDDGRRVQGYYHRGRRTVVLAGAYVESDPVVRHEMLHAVLEQPGHPPVFDRCGLSLNQRRQGE